MITLVQIARTASMMESTALLSTRSQRLRITLALSLLLSSIDPSLSFATIPRLSTTVKVSRRPRQASHRYAETKPTDTKRRHLPGKVIRIYTDYATRLWKETNPEARDIVRSSKVAMALRQVQSMASTESGAMDCVPAPDRLELVRACENVLQAIAAKDSKIAKESEKALLANGQSPTLRQYDESVSVTTSPPVDDTTRTDVATTATSTAPTLKPKRTRRSIGFGAVMGFAVACWVFSGNYIFTGLFTMMTILGQLEYYRMVMNTGIYPARRISVVGACSMFLAALFTPDLHQIVLPISGLWAMVWFLTMRRRVTHIPEIATTFTGMFYLGYVPSFWVRIRLIGMGREPTRLAPFTGPMLRYLEAKGKTLPSFIPQAVHLPITTGAIFIFWTWICLAFSDVGAYFIGRVYGKTKLGVIAPAAGATSPNKTVEGVVGGCAVSAVLAILGAWVQRWPHPVWTGAIHGILLGLLGLLGDLTASMLKRDAGLKDFGDLLPEHGGIMDRVDSFIWAAPYS
jgi:phosphatidate cytidylyltransferase